MSSFPVLGSSLLYPWPKINGLFSTNESELIAEEIKYNNSFYLSEKIDGCNVCVSSNGWVGSRKVIISERKRVSKNYINKISLKKFESVFEQLDLLKENLKKLGIDPKEIILYGEVIMNWTASSSYDVFHYQQKNYLPGDFIIFGIAFIYDLQNETFTFKRQLKRLLIENMNNCQMENTEDTPDVVFRSFINKDNAYIFNNLDLKLVKFYKNDNLSNIIQNPDYLKQLKDRSTEGFVLHNENLALKFKYSIRISKNYMSRHMNYVETILKATCRSYEHKQKLVFDALNDLLAHDKKWINNLDKTKVNLFFKNKMLKWEIELLSFAKNSPVTSSWLNCFIIAVYAEFFNDNTNPELCFIDKTVEFEVRKIFFKYFTSVLHRYNIPLK